jgi:hypothetical protein
MNGDGDNCLSFRKFFTFFKIFLNNLFIDRTRAATNIDARLDGMEARLDGMEARLDGMEARLDRLEAQIKLLLLLLVCLIVCVTFYIIKI